MANFVAIKNRAIQKDTRHFNYTCFVIWKKESNERDYVVQLAQVKLSVGKNFVSGA